jgi:fumarate hydratase class II
MPTIKIDDGEYDVDTLTDAQKKLIAELQKIEERIKEKNNMVAILIKAKRAYIADLKQEIISSKAGLDLFE